MLTIVRAVAFTAAGQPAQARACMGAALQSADDTRVHFYDAELLRPRANTHNEPKERRADVGAARELARRLGPTLVSRLLRDEDGAAADIAGVEIVDG